MAIESISTLTALDLFPLYPPEFEQTQTLNQQGNLLRTSKQTSQEAFNKLENTIFSRGDNLGRTIDELDEAADDLNSSVTISEFYLKLSGEMSPMGASPSETMDVFRFCTNIYSQICVARRAELVGKNNNYKNSTMLLPHKYTLQLHNLIDKNITDPPVWFKGNFGEWRYFMGTHSAIALYLNPELERLDTNQITLQQSKKLMKVVFPGSEPDWLIDLEDNQIPSPEDIQAELEEDLQQLSNVEQQIETARTQQQQLLKLNDAELMRSITYLEKERRKLPQRPRSLAQLICVLHALEDFTVREADLEALETDHGLIPEKYRQREINRFTEWNSGFSSWQMTALWLENQAREARLSVGEPLTPQLADNFKSVFVGSQINPANLPSNLEELRRTDKKLFQFIFYSLHPLSSIIDQANLPYLREIIEANVGQPLIKTVQEIAEGTAEATVDNYIATISDPTSRVSDDLIKFSKRWLNNHWASLYEKLNDRLINPTHLRSEESPPQIVGRDDYGLTEQVQEMSDLGQQIQRGNLGGWQLLYSTDGKFKEDELIPIVGDSITDLQTSLENAVRRNRIPFYGSPSSVIRSFDSKATEIKSGEEWTEWRIFIDGQPYKKFRQNRRNRIIYQMDYENRTIRFHTYLKKADNYKGL